MTERVAHYRRRLLLVAAGWMAVAGMVATPSQAQTPTAASPSFEVATIKPNKSDRTGYGVQSLSDSFTMLNATVKDLIAMAYGFPMSLDGIDGVISGGPSWVNSARFDIVGKVPQPRPKEWESIPNLNKLMLQALLADRFKLKVHHETRELPVYALTVARNGPKLTPWVAPTALVAESAPTYAFGAKLPTPQKDHWHGIRPARGEMKAMQATTWMLAGSLMFYPEISGRMVIDKTGLTGEYDFTLQWLPQEESERMKESGLPKPDASLPGLFTALQEELGLELESTKGPVDTIVIDSVEMPSEN